MYLRNEDGRLVVRVADFYNEYLNTISIDMGPTHFMCLVLIDSVENYVDIYPVCEAKTPAFMPGMKRA